jgi:hypothetical protein
MQVARSKWSVPLVAVSMGLIIFAAQWIGGSLAGGLISLAILTGAGVLVLVSGRSETVRGLRGDGRDERFAQIDLQATAAAGLAVILAIIIAFVVEVARGHSGAPFTWLGAIAGLAYLLSVVALRRRG